MLALRTGSTPVALATAYTVARCLRNGATALPELVLSDGCTAALETIRASTPPSSRCVLPSETDQLASVPLQMLPAPYLAVTGEQGGHTKQKQVTSPHFAVQLSHAGGGVAGRRNGRAGAPILAICSGALAGGKHHFELSGRSGTSSRGSGLSPLVE